MRSKYLNRIRREQADFDVMKIQREIFYEKLQEENDLFYKKWYKIFFFVLGFPSVILMIIAIILKILHNE